MVSLKSTLAHANHLKAVKSKTFFLRCDLCIMPYYLYIIINCDIRFFFVHDLL